MRLGFAGTPEFAAIILRELIKTSHDVVRILTQPARPTGRGRKSLSSAVQQEAQRHGIVCVTPTNLRGRKDLVADLDLLVVAAYGMILPPEIFRGPQFASLNVHASLLPRWRGAAPIQRCIEAGDKVTGITIMQMNAGLDTGDMLAKITTGIFATDTGGSLHDRLAQLGPKSMLAVLADVEAGTLKPEVQNNGLACYAHKLSKQEALIDWSQSAETLALRIRAFNPFPMAYTLLGDERIRVLAAEARDSMTTLQPGTIASVANEGIDVACGEGTLRLTQVQLAGKKAMSVADVINGQPKLFQPLYVLAADL